MKFDVDLARKDFDDFIKDMSHQVAWLESEAASHGVKLEMAGTTPEQMEYLFDLLSQGLDGEDTSGLIVVFGRYLGEFMVYRYGGKWKLPLDDMKNVYFNTPVIVGHSAVADIEFDPIGLFRAYFLRKKSGGIRRAIDSHINPKELDLSKQIQDEEQAGNNG